MTHDEGRSGLRIEYLADHPDLIPELARLHFAEWGHLHLGETLEERTRGLRDSCSRGEIPSVLVALDGSALCGSAMLVEHDMATRRDLAPWLAGVEGLLSDPAMLFPGRVHRE